MSIRERIANWLAPVASRPDRRPARSHRVRYGLCGPEVVAFSGPTIGYSSAAAMREFVGKATLASSDAHAEHDLYDLMAEAERSFRDNTIMRALVNRLVDFICGEGPTPQIGGLSDSQNKEVQTRFEVWWHGTPEVRGMDDGSELVRQMVRERLVPGRLGIIPIERLGQLQFIAGTRIASVSRYQDGEGRPIIGGVETDELNRPSAFWVGSWDDTRTYLREAERPIPARNFWYWPFRLRNDETAGHPPLQAVQPLIHRLNDVSESLVYAWQLMSKFVGIVELENGAQIGKARSAARDFSDVSEEFRGRAADFGIGTLFFGEKGKTDFRSIPHNIPGLNFTEGAKMFLRLIGMELGLSLEFLLLIWSDTNYSSGRMSSLQVQRNLKPWIQGLRGQDARSGMLGRIFNWWYQRGVVFDGLPRGDAYCEWHFPNYPFIDPQKEVEAEKAEIGAGMKTQTRALRERGYDLDDVMDERAIELGKAAERVKAHNAAHPDAPVTLQQFIETGENPKAEAAPSSSSSSDTRPSPPSSGQPAPESPDSTSDADATD